MLFLVSWFWGFLTGTSICGTKDWHFRTNLTGSDCLSETPAQDGSHVDVPDYPECGICALISVKTTNCTSTKVPYSSLSQKADWMHLKCIIFCRHETSCIGSTALVERVWHPARQTGLSTWTTLTTWDACAYVDILIVIQSSFLRNISIFLCLNPRK